MKRNLAAGFDLGGTQLKYGLVDDAGRLLLKAKAATPATMDGLLGLIEESWRKIEAKSPGPVRSCGFGFAGFYSLRDRKILHSPNYQGLDGFDLIPALRRFIDVPVAIDNDANMAAYGEYMYGAGRGAQSLVFITVGTGIGSGIILEGRLWHGPCGFAGEIGHITVNPEGEPCNCGGRGCLETEAAAPRIIRHYQTLSGQVGSLTTKEIYLRARQGDEAAREAFARAGRWLGVGLGIIINFLNPAKILIGGGVVAAGRLLLGPVIAEARRQAHPVLAACTKIEKASLRNDAGLVGAAAWSRTAAGRRPR
jgi:glucokinase